MKKQRIISIFLALALVTSLLPTASAFSYTQMSQDINIMGYEITTVAPEVQFLHLNASNSEGMQNINAVEFNPQNPYTLLRAGKSQGYVWSTQTVNTIATNMSDINGDVAVAAINGDFFTFGVGVPHGIFIEDGIILSTPPQYYAAFGLTYDNEPFIVRHGTILDKIFRIGESLVDIAGINMAHTANADSLMLYTEEYARGTKTGSETYELRCRINFGEVRHGSTINFTVEEIYDSVGNTTLGDGYIVLSAQGARIDDLKKLSIGDTLEMSFRFNEFWSNVKFAVGGNELLLQNGEVYSTADKSKQPRTSIGIREDGTVVMATFDGRGAGNAAGMSYKAAAEAMRALGCVDALNLDGGGSTTFVLRNPGSLSTSIVNNLSGSSARSVANALVLMNTAPTGYAESLVVSPKSRLVLLGGKYSFAVTGAYDSNFKPLAVPDNILWETDSYINELTDDGVLEAVELGTFAITAYADGAEGSAKIEIVDRIDSLVTDITELTVKAGDTVEIKASALFEGREVEASPDLFSWSAPETLGTFTAPGIFTVAENAVEGEITVSYGDAFATVKLSPIVPPVAITGFEGDLVSFIPVGISTNVKPNAKLETDPNRIHDGEQSLKVYYNFLNTTGSVGSYYMVSPESSDNSALFISSVPKKIGMRVFGDGSGIDLRSIIEDANGVQHTLTYGKIDHEGWKYMEATLPENLAGPIYIKVPVHIVSNPEKLTHGCLYFDSMRAVYTELEQDMASPFITKAWPDSNMLIYGRNPSIGVILDDEGSGIDPKTVEIIVNGWNCTDRTYNEETKKISYTVKVALKPGYHTIAVRARDNAGNLLMKEWKYEVR